MRGPSLGPSRKARELASVCRLIEQRHGKGAIRCGNGDRLKTRKRPPSFLKTSSARRSRGIVKRLIPGWPGLYVCFYAEQARREVAFEDEIACHWLEEVGVEYDESDLDEVDEEAQAEIGAWYDEEAQRKFNRSASLGGRLMDRVGHIRPMTRPRPRASRAGHRVRVQRRQRSGARGDPEPEPPLAAAPLRGVTA